MIHMTLDCVRPTQSSVIQIIHHNVGLIFSFIEMFDCYYCYTFIFQLYLTR